MRLQQVAFDEMTDAKQFFFFSVQLIYTMKSAHPSSLGLLYLKRSGISLNKAVNRINV